jgi:hypothetical protein
VKEHGQPRFAANTTGMSEPATSKCFISINCCVGG